MTDEDKRKLAKQKCLCWQPIADHAVVRARYVEKFGRDPEYIFDYMGMTWAWPAEEVKK